MCLEQNLYFPPLYISLKQDSSKRSHWSREATFCLRRAESVRTMLEHRVHRVRELWSWVVCHKGPLGVL